jgi:hypothetical protein
MLRRRRKNTILARCLAKWALLRLGLGRLSFAANPDGNSANVIPRKDS